MQDPIDTEIRGGVTEERGERSVNVNDPYHSSSPAYCAFAAKIYVPSQ